MQRTVLNRSARTPERWVRCRAFTLLELGMTIFIIALVIAVIFPALGAIKRGAYESSGANGVVAGVIAARAYAPRDRIGIFADIDGNGSLGNYSGVAILFTPANELRLIENVPHAVDQSNDFLELIGLNGYADIPGRDYIVLPANRGYMGITRIDDDSGPGVDSALVLLPPPFAMRFDENGQLSPGGENTDANYVYYDGDYDDKWETTNSDDRDVAYDPTAWDPDWNMSLTKHVNRKLWPLPFDKIETVIGVLVFDKAEVYSRFKGSGMVSSGQGMPHKIVILDKDPIQNVGVVAWMLKNSQQMFFSRYSGTVMR